jgi:hypothetical protein
MTISLTSLTIKTPNIRTLTFMGNCSENSVLLYLQILYFRLHVTCKSYIQVLTPITNFQLLLKLEILDKLRLVTSHTKKTKHFYWFNLDRRNGSSLDHEPQSIDVTTLAALSVLTFSLSMQPKLWHSPWLVISANIT